MLTLFLVCSLVLSSSSQLFAYPLEPSSDAASLQAAEILGVEREVNRLLILRNQKDALDLHADELLSLRGSIMRSILLGCLAVREACNLIDAELAYTYEISEREQERTNNANRMFNLFNFLQGGILYAIEGRSKIHKQDTQSFVLTTVQAGLSAGLPALNIQYNKYSKIRNLAKSEFRPKVPAGGPVDGNNMPELVSRYLASTEPGQSRTRKDEMYSLWKRRFGVDPAIPSSLCNLNDGKAKSISAVKKRIQLLWSLHTYVERFDSDLLSLLALVRSPAQLGDRRAPDLLSGLGLSSGAIEAAQLLGIEPELAELIKLNGSNSDRLTRLKVETVVLERVLSGCLELRVAVDNINEDLNYSFDVILAQLLSDRAKQLQRTTEANFITKGTLGATGGLLDLKGYGKAGNETFIVSYGLGSALTSLALWQSRGGKRKIDTAPNSLADFFDLRNSDQNSFTPLIASFLNSPAPGRSDRVTRKEELRDIWKREHISTVNLDSNTNMTKLAGCPPAKFDTIAIVSSRISLLQSLRVRLTSFDSELFDILRSTERSEPTVANPRATTMPLPQNTNGSASATGEILDAQSQLQQLIQLKTTAAPFDLSVAEQQLAITRKVLSAFLEVRMTAANVETEIASETQVLGRMTRARDMAITLTNNANFYQVYVLGILLYGPLGLSSVPRYNLYADRLKVIAGLVGTGLASASFLEYRGGLRPTKVAPNMLGACFGLQSKATSQFCPHVLKFLNSPVSGQASNATRREVLLSYWRSTKHANLDLSKRSVIEKVAATGSSHHWWNESIKLIRSRVDLLYDLRAVIDEMDSGLSELLRASS